jgi:[acyl-carrier-protein] S-malonyltransferase
MMRAFLFPGQGSQSVGMGKALADASPAAKELFQEVDDALAQHLFRIMVEGPESDLILTENAQPAIMANALATLRVMQREAGFSLAEKGDFVAGHSLGEYSALCAAEAFDIGTTSRLLKLRGQAMQAAVPWGRAPWPLCWAPTLKRRRRWLMPLRKAKSAPLPTTMIRPRLSSPATAAQSSARSRW